MLICSTLVQHYHLKGKKYVETGVHIFLAIYILLSLYYIWESTPLLPSAVEPPAVSQFYYFLPLRCQEHKDKTFLLPVFLKQWSDFPFNTGEMDLQFR